MSEQNESENAAPPIHSAPAPQATTLKPFSYWVKRLLVCNPFYLVSAALLLFGMYRISVDRNVFGEEISQLIFNLGSLEFYEILLVATAIFLAARRVWYDATLLVSLENLFVLVPFILLSQVALINRQFVWVVCGAIAVIAILRFGALRRYFSSLNLPGRVLLFGVVLLAVNIALLATYRVVGETKLGFPPDHGRDFAINQLTWLGVLPAALALLNFLPHARENGSLEPQRRWLPAAFCTFWMLATAVHLYCLNYIYNFAFRVEMLAPAVWVLAWAAYRRLPEFLNHSSDAMKQGLAIAPMVVAFLAVAQSGNKIFFTLMLLNVAVYGIFCLQKQNRDFAKHLLFASVMLSVCGLPEEWVRLVIPTWQGGPLVFTSIAVYLMLYILMSRNPHMGIVGAVVTGIVIFMVFNRHESAVPWALQGALVFLLLHSLRWMDAANQGAVVVRALAAALWVMHSCFWVRSGAAMWAPCIPGGVVLGAYLMMRLLRGRQDLLFLPAASILTVLSGPGNALINWLLSAPGGLLALIGSFLLFALGTILAVTKHRWHRPHLSS